MTLLQKINNLTWWNEPNKLKDILKDLANGSGTLSTLFSPNNTIKISGVTNNNIEVNTWMTDLIYSSIKTGGNISDLVNNSAYISQNKMVFKESVIGILNGVNATFQIQNSITPNTEQITVNGQIQKKPQDYNISRQNITFTFSPQSQEVILIDYIKQ